MNRNEASNILRGRVLAILKKQYSNVREDFIISALHDALLKYEKRAPKHVKDSDRASISWIVTTAGNEIKNILRKEEDNDLLIDDLSDDDNNQVNDMIDKMHNHNYENDMDFKMLYEIILSQLTPRQQEIFKLALYEYTNSAIALKLGISERTVNYEKKKCKEIILKYYPPPLIIF